MSTPVDDGVARFENPINLEDDEPFEAEPRGQSSSPRRQVGIDPTQDAADDDDDDEISLIKTMTLALTLQAAASAGRVSLPSVPR